MAMKRLLIDIDGTLARFHDEASYLERMYEPNFFANLQPFENVVEGIRRFIQRQPEVDVYVCSAAIETPHCEEEKNAWLDRYLPEVELDHRIFTEMGRSKAEYLRGDVTKDDFLLDDYNKGLHMFLGDGGSAIKCHNNINQRGQGAHGGERGYMWDGPMIHAEDDPNLIATELCQLMGINYDIRRAMDGKDEILGDPFNDPAEIDRNKLPTGKFLFSGGMGGGFDAVEVLPKREGGRVTTHFDNPFNAIRYLRGDEMALERKLTTYKGDIVRASGYQLQAVAQNAFGSMDYSKFVRADHSQMAEKVKRSLGNRGKAVVGFVCEINPDGEEFARVTFHRQREMLRYIARLDEIHQPHKEEWFILPKVAARGKEQLDSLIDLAGLSADECERWRNHLLEQGVKELHDLCLESGSADYMNIIREKHDNQLSGSIGDNDASCFLNYAQEEYGVSPEGGQLPEHIANDLDCAYFPAGTNIGLDDFLDDIYGGNFFAVCSDTYRMEDRSHIPHGETELSFKAALREILTRPGNPISIYRMESARYLPSLMAEAGLTFQSDRHPPLVSVLSSAELRAGQMNETQIISKERDN